MGLCAQKTPFELCLGTILCVKDLAIYEMFSNKISTKYDFA